MRLLIVATNKTADNIHQQVKSGQHQRVDYLELSERFAAEYVDYNRINSNRITGWLAARLRIDFSQAVYVARLVHTQGYDTVLSLSERVGIPLALCLNRQVKHIVIMHHPLSPKKLWLIKRLGLHQRWHKIIAISQAEAAVLRQTLGLGEDRVLAVNTPVDTDFFAPYEEEAPLRQRDHIQSVGLSYRDYPTLINAMKLLPQIKCHLRVGSAWVQSDTGFSPDALPENVEIKPYVHPSLLKQCFAQSRFIVVPIRQTTQWSAGCTSVHLAQAMGRAVITTNVPGLRDYVSEGETGLLVEPGNPVAMAEAIDYLWRNPEKAAAMGRHGVEWIRSKFSIDTWLDQIELMLQLLLLLCYVIPMAL